MVCVCASVCEWSWNYTRNECARRLRDAQCGLISEPFKGTWEFIGSKEILLGIHKACCSPFSLSHPNIPDETNNQPGQPTAPGAKRLHFGGERGAVERKLEETFLLWKPQKVQGSGTSWRLFFLSLCHPLNKILCFLFQPEGEAKGTRHQKISSGQSLTWRFGYGVGFWQTGRGPLQTWDSEEGRPGPKGRQEQRT